MRRRRYSRVNNSLIEALEGRELFSMVVLNHFRSFKAAGTQQFPAKAGVSISVAPPQPQPQEGAQGTLIVLPPSPFGLGQSGPSGCVLTMSQPAIQGSVTLNTGSGTPWTGGSSVVTGAIMSGLVLNGVSGSSSVSIVNAGTGEATAGIFKSGTHVLWTANTDPGQITLLTEASQGSVLNNMAYSTVTSGGAMTLRANTAGVIVTGANGSITLVNTHAATTGIILLDDAILRAAGGVHNEPPSEALQESTYYSSSTSLPSVTVTDLGTAEGLASFMKSLSKAPANVGGATTSLGEITEYVAQ